MSNPVIDLATETPLSLTAAAKRLPPLRGRPVASATVLRWVLRGTLLPDGTRVRLAAVKFGATWTTTVEALDRYRDAVTAASLRTSDRPAEAPRSPAERERASGKVDE